jgi:predicted adenine nucleotide alpha hydrolase (AANH) superfamily ATPase
VDISRKKASRIQNQLGKKHRQILNIPFQAREIKKKGNKQKAPTLAKSKIKYSS